MSDISEHVIDGAMFLRNCSREEAIAWLTGEVTPEEIEHFEKHDRLGRMLVESLKFNEEEKREFIRRARFWEANDARLIDGIRRSQIITAADLAVRVGPC